MVEELTLHKAIDFAVETEKLGLHYYGKLAKRFKDDAELHEVFATLARDEERHAQRFAALRDKAPPQKGPLQFEQQQYLRAIALSEIFAKERGIAKDPESIASKADALERAFNMEQTSLLYYQEMKKVLEADLLDEIIAEEKKHVVQIMKLMITDAKLRGLDDDYNI